MEVAATSGDKSGNNQPTVATKTVAKVQQSTGGDKKQQSNWTEAANNHSRATLTVLQILYKSHNQPVVSTNHQ